MHDTENDNHICDAVGKVTTESGKNGFGFVKPSRKIVEHGNGSTYIDFEHNEVVYLKGKDGENKDAFVRWESIIAEEGRHKAIYIEDIIEFKLYNGRKGLYAVDVRKVDSIYDENGYVKEVTKYGISNLKG